MAYREVEGVSTDDLMGMGSGILAGSNERISTLDSQLRACESKHVLSRDSLAQKGASGEGFFPHGEDFAKTSSNDAMRPVTVS
jgi:hypothetical protein